MQQERLASRGDSADLQRSARGIQLAALQARGGERGGGDAGVRGPPVGEHLLNVHVSDTCLPTVQILVAPVTSTKCKPKWYQYVDLEAVWLCGGPSSSLLLGPAATGIGKTPFIMAFPHISAF